MFYTSMVDNPGKADMADQFTTYFQQVLQSIYGQHKLVVSLSLFLRRLRIANGPLIDRMRESLGDAIFYILNAVRLTSTQYVKQLKYQHLDVFKCFWYNRQ